jgi:hypothetical protein
MRPRSSYACLLAGLTLAMAANAQQWFMVLSPGADENGTSVEVLDSLPLPVRQTLLRATCATTKNSTK